MSLRVSGTMVTSSAAPFIDAIWRSSVDSVADVDGTLGHSRRHSPILVRHGHPTSFTVRVRGDPAPLVTWYVGKKPLSAAGNAGVSGDGRFRLESDSNTGRHTLRVSGDATEDLDEGVWVIAGNDVGQDCTAIKVKTYRVLSRVADGSQLDSDSLPLRFRLRRKKSTDGRPLKSSSSGHHSLPRELDSTRQRHKRASGEQKRSPYHSSTGSRRPRSSFEGAYDDDFPTTNEKSPSGTNHVTSDRRQPSQRLPSDNPGRATPESLGLASDSFNESVASSQLSPKLSSNSRPRRRVNRRQPQQQPHQLQRQTPPPALHEQQALQSLSHADVPSAVDFSSMAEKSGAGGMTAKNGTKKKKRKKRDLQQDNDDNKENNEETVTASSVDNDSNCSRLVVAKNKVKKPSKSSNSVNPGGGSGRTDDGSIGTDVVDLTTVKVDETDNFRRIEQWRKQSGDHYPTREGEDLRCDNLAVDKVDAIENDWSSSLWKINGCDIRLSTFCAGLLGSAVIDENRDVDSPISLLSPPMTDMECLESSPAPSGVLSMRRHRNGSGKRSGVDRTSGGHGGADSALGDSMLSNDDLSSTTTEPANLSTSMLLPPPPNYALTSSGGIGRQNSWPESADWWRDEQNTSASEAIDSETQGVSHFAVDSTTADTIVRRAPSNCTADDERAAENDDDNDESRYDEMSSEQPHHLTSDITGGGMTADDELTANTDSESESILRRNSPHRQHPQGIVPHSGDSMRPDKPPAMCDNVPSADTHSLAMGVELLPSVRSEVSDDDELSTSSASSSSVTGSFTVVTRPATQAADMYGRPSPSSAWAAAPRTSLYIVDIDISDVDSGRGATSASSADGDGKRGRNVERKARRSRPKSDVFDIATSKSTDGLDCRESIDEQLAPATNGQRSSSGGRTVSPPIVSQDADSGRRVLSKSVDLLVPAKRPRNISRTRQRTLSRERFQKVTTTIKTETTILVPPTQRSSSCGNIDRDGGSRLSTYFVTDIECDAVFQSLSPSSLSDDDDDVSNEHLVPATSCPDDSAVDTVSEPETDCAIDRRPKDDHNSTASRRSTLCETDFPYIVETVDSFAVAADESCPSAVTHDIICELSYQQVPLPQADVNACIIAARQTHPDETAEGHSEVLSVEQNSNATAGDRPQNDVIGRGMTPTSSLGGVISADEVIGLEDDRQVVAVDDRLVDLSDATSDAWLIVDRAIHEIQSGSYVTLIVDRAMEMVNYEIQSLSGINDGKTDSSLLDNAELDSITTIDKGGKVERSDEQKLLPTESTPDKSTVVVHGVLIVEEADKTVESRPESRILEAIVESDTLVAGLQALSLDEEVWNSETQLTDTDASIPDSSVDAGQYNDTKTKTVLVDPRASDVVDNARDLDDPRVVNNLDRITDVDENNDDDSSSMSVVIDAREIIDNSPSVACPSIESDERLNEVDKESLSTLSNMTNGFSDDDVGCQDNDDDDGDDDGKDDNSWDDSWWMKTTTKTTITICNNGLNVSEEPRSKLRSEPTQIWNYNPLTEHQKVVNLIDDVVIHRETQTPTEEISKCNRPRILGDIPCCDVTAPPTDLSSPSSSKRSMAFSIQSIVIGSNVAGPSKRSSFSREVSMEPADLDLDGHDNPCVDGELTADLDGINAIHSKEPEMASLTNTDVEKGAVRPPSPISSTSTVVHEYGEMLTIFGRLPPFVEALKPSVAHRHELDPQICRLLARYPSLRPGTWQWTVLPRIEDLRRQVLGPKADDEQHGATETSQATRVKSESAALAVVNSTSYVIEPVVERFDDVVARVD